VTGCDSNLLDAIARTTGGMFTMANSVEVLNIFFLYQIMITLFIIQMAKEIENLLNREILKQFLYEKTGHTPSDAELDGLISMIATMTKRGQTTNNRRSIQPAPSSNRNSIQTTNNRRSIQPAPSSNRNVRLEDKDYSDAKIKTVGLCYIIAAIVLAIGYSTQAWYSATVCSEFFCQYTSVGLYVTTICAESSCTTTSTADLGNYFTIACLATPIAGGVGGFFMLVVLLTMCCHCFSKPTTRGVGLLSGLITISAAGAFAILGYLDSSQIPGANIGFSFYLVLSAGILCLLSSFGIK